MIIICGTKGTGKTTLAQKISEQMNYKYVSDWWMRENSVDCFEFVKENASRKIVLDLDYANSNDYFFDDENVRVVYLGFKSKDREKLIGQFMGGGKYEKYGAEKVIDNIIKLSENYFNLCQAKGLEFHFIEDDRNLFLENIFNELKRTMR